MDYCLVAYAFGNRYRMFTFDCMHVSGNILHIVKEFDYS